MIMFCVFVLGGCNALDDCDCDHTNAASENGDSDNANPQQNTGTGDNNTTGGAAVIDGTWKIESGRATIWEYNKMRNLTYTPTTDIGEIGIEMTQNTGQYAYSYGKDTYAMTLSGKNVMMSGAYGGGIVVLIVTDFTYDDNPEETGVIMGSPLQGNHIFSYLGNNTYEMTEAAWEKVLNYNNYGAPFTHTVKLENPSTLRIAYEQKFDQDVLGNVPFAEACEFVLSRVR